MRNKKQKRAYVVVDLEATGTGVDAKIIQVGIVRIENGQIGQTFETDINPNEPLTEHIKNLTGITDKQLAQAPEFSQVARQIYELVNDAVFVAHNVKFDANLLAEALMFEGFDLLTPRVDTVELAQVFFPSLPKYNLGYLTEALDIELAQAHTAISDAMATAELFLRLQRKMAELPRVTLEQILNFSDALLYESRLAIEEVLQTLPDRLPENMDLVEGLVLKKQQAYPAARKLSQDFKTNLALLGLDERSQQLEFAQILSQRLFEKEVSFIEAQSGLGKTYAYLLTLLAQPDAQQIVVTVPTKLLQDQIMAQEARRISQIFHINFHSLKGPANYIKLDHFYNSLQVQDDNRLINRYKMQILVWLTETVTGDLSELSQRQRYKAYFDQIKHDGKLAVSSRFSDHDFWQVSYQKSRESRVIITNHAYFLTRVEDDKTFIENKILVVDEAQKMFLALEQFSRRHLNLTQFLQNNQARIGLTTSTLEQRLLESLQFRLSDLARRFHKHQLLYLPEAEVASLRQDIQELSTEELSDLAALFHPHYQHYWMESELVNDKRQTSLCAARMDFLDFSQFLPESTKTICVSATLQISRKISIAHLLGFERFSFDSLPKQLDVDQMIFTIKDGSDVAQITEDENALYMAEQLAHLVSLNKPILVLFNSISTMLKTSDCLSQFKVNHMAQHRHGEAMQLKRRFERGESQLLLGTGAFWEGVDFASQPQLLEVITRLPFDNPKDIFVKKINDALRAQGQSPFYDYSLPVVILRLKQAIGRTKRSQRQQSAVIILDGRLYKKRYGKQIIQALSEHHQLEQLNLGQLPAQINQFFEEGVGENW